MRLRPEFLAQPGHQPVDRGIVATQHQGLDAEDRSLVLIQPRTAFQHSANARLQRVQLESLPALQVIRKYDSAETLFYVDPPYMHSTRGDANGYRYEMTDDEHAELADALKSCKGKVALSGYRNGKMDKMFKQFRRVDLPEKRCHSTKGLRQESVWMNY